MTSCLVWKIFSCFYFLEIDACNSVTASIYFKQKKLKCCLTQLVGVGGVPISLPDITGAEDKQSVRRSVKFILFKNCYKEDFFLPPPKLLVNKGTVTFFLLESRLSIQIC